MAKKCRPQKRQKGSKDGVLDFCNCLSSPLSIECAYMFALVRITFCLLLFSSCGPLADPSNSGDAPYQRDDVWAGPIIPPEALDVLPDLEPKPSGPLNAAALINMGLQNNPLTQRSWQDARAAAFNWEASQSQLYPTVDWLSSIEFDVQEFKDQDSDTGGGGTAVAGAGAITPSGFSISNVPYNQIVTHQLTVNYLLLDFGGRDASIEAAKHALFAADWTHNRILQDVIIGVLRSYYLYLEAAALLEAQKLNLKDAQTNYDTAEAQFQAGIRTHVDALQARANLVNAQLILEQAWGNLKIASGQLAAAVGLPANDELEVEKLPDNIPYDTVAANLEDLLQVAKDARPDLAAAYALYLERRAQLVVARSAGLPTVTANVELQWLNNIHFPSQNSRFRTGSIALNIPIFAGFLFYNQERQASSIMESAYANLQVVESDVYLQVVTAYYAFVTAGEAVKYSTELLQYSQEAYNATYSGYRAGINTIADLFNAQSTLANARAQYIQTRTEWIIALANISYATGNL